MYKTQWSQEWILSFLTHENFNSRVLPKTLGMPPYLCLVALRTKKQKMNWVLQLAVILCAMMSLILSSFVFSLCPLIYNYCNLIRYSHSSIVSRCSCKQTVDISIYVGGLWGLWFLRWSFLISIFFIRTPELTQFFVSSCDWINQLVPLWHTSVERCIPFNCSKCTVFQIIMNYSQNRYLFSTFFTAIKCIYLIALFTH